MTTDSRPRPGVTLLEVLVAIFVMALGLLALLTLFPLGAMQLGQALKDDRTAQTANQADGFLRSYWRHAVIENSPPDSTLVNSFSFPNTAPPTPNATVPVTGQLNYGGTAATYPQPTAGQPSYPVMVDPLGFWANQAGSQPQFWMARSMPGLVGTPLLLPRRNLNAATLNSNAAVLDCSLVDDMTFQPNGVPGSTLDRQGRYNWAAVIQQPNVNTPTVANLTILVFDGRPPLLAAPGDEAVVTQTWTSGLLPTPDFSNLTPAPLILVPGSRTVTLLVPNRNADQAPLVRRGGWIMDGTIDATLGVRNANFYRIAGVTAGTPNTTTGVTPFILDLDTEIKGPASPTGAQVYLFAGLSEVFARSPLRPDSNLP